MAKSTDIHVKKITNSTHTYLYRQPMKFGGRVVEDVCVLRTEVAIQTSGSRKKITGIGEMTMGNAWAWPSKIPGKMTLKVMLELADRLAAEVESAGLSGDPLQIAHEIGKLRDKVSAAMVEEYKLGEPIPKLAAMVAASPLDAAIHDAFGRSIGKNSFECMTKEYLNQDLSAYLGPEFAQMYPGQFLNAKPRPTLHLYHLVGALDPLTDVDIRTRLNDGYPETLEEWLKTDGVSHLKIKLAGNNIDWDVGRIVEVTRICENVGGRSGSGNCRSTSMSNVQTKTMSSTCLNASSGSVALHSIDFNTSNNQRRAT